MKFRDVPIHSMVFVGGLPMFKISFRAGKMPMCGSTVLVNPNKECEEVESISMTGKKGSKYTRDGAIITIPREEEEAVTANAPPINEEGEYAK